MGYTILLLIVAIVDTTRGRPIWLSTIRQRPELIAASAAPGLPQHQQQVSMGQPPMQQYQQQQQQPYQAQPMQPYGQPQYTTMPQPQIPGQPGSHGSQVQLAPPSQPSSTPVSGQSAGATSYSQPYPQV